VGLSGKFWHPASKSVKTEKASGVFGCGKPEDLPRMSAEMNTAAFETKALPFHEWDSLRCGGFPKDKLLIMEGQSFGRSRARSTLT